MTFVVGAGERGRQVINFSALLFISLLPDCFDSGSRILGDAAVTTSLQLYHDIAWQKSNNGKLFKFTKGLDKLMEDGSI